MNCDRRTVLRALAGAAAGGAAGLAGCAGDGDGNGDGDGDGGTRPGTTPDRGTAGSGTPTPRATPTVAAPDASTGTGSNGGSATNTADGRLVLERVDGTPEVPLTVYRPEMRTMLREAATTGDAVRTSVSTVVDNPRPVLPSYGAVELRDEAGDAGGVYEVTCEGGTRYEMALHVEEAPDAADPTPVSEFSGDRRELLVSAIEGDYVGVYQETRRGEWVREEVFGHAFAYDGSAYHVTEIHPTDAAFFSQQVWYVLSLAPTDAGAVDGDPVRLRLRDVPGSVRFALDELVSEGVSRSAPERATTADLSPAVRSFAAGTEGVLSHVGAMAVSLE